MLRLSKGILYLEAKDLISSGIVFFASVEALETDKLADYGYKTNENSISVGTTFQQYENFYINDIRRNVFLLTQRLSIKEVYL